MEFDDVLASVISLLRRERRVSYRALKLRFHLDDDYLEALRDEIIDAKQLAMDEHGKVLVCIEHPYVVSPLTTAPLENHGAQAERRQITVMFCDLVESTALSTRFDPEELREIMRAYQATCAEVIEHFEGHIAQYLGDSLLVYYGYPYAHEDDAHRALRTGLSIINAMETLNTRLAREHQVQLAVRIGIHTGLVVIGEMGGGGRHEHLALGQPPNIASRLQSVAQPNTVVISDATYRLTQGFFVCHDGGNHAFKGVDTPIRVYRVLRESGIRNHLDVAMTTTLTSLVGREEEVAVMLRHWQQVQEGLGNVVILSGEAGIGKSRLVMTLYDAIGPEYCARIVFRCSSYHTNSAFYSVIDTLEQVLHWLRDDTPIKKLLKLERLLQENDLPLQEIVPLMASLLSLPLPEGRYAPLNLNPNRLKQQTQEALLAWLIREAERRPILVVWEDLHWADPSTLELLGLLIDQIPAVRILLLLTFRSEFYAPWGMPSHLTKITLGRLGQEQVAQMINHVTRGKALPNEVVQQVIAKTDGVPLFVEELMKMVLESGLVSEQGNRYILTGPLPPLAIPTTLQDSLMARLDRLGTAREIAQLGATLGREFTYEELQSVARVDEVTLHRALAQLVEAELLHQCGAGPAVYYVFKHALILETAYQSLLKSTRQQHHQRIAHVLATQFPCIAERQPERLAHHYTEAGLHEQAIPYWQKAGRLAIRRSAHLESINHLTKGLELLKAIPVTSERLQLELALNLDLGLPLLMIKGHTALEVEQTYGRAHELCQQVGESPQLFSALAGLWRFYLARANLRTTRELSEQCFGLAQRLHDPMLLQEAYLMMGTTLFYLGELEPAHAHLEQSIARYEPQQGRSQVLTRPNDLGVLGLCLDAWTLWALGYADQALRRSEEALALAQTLSHAYSQGMALHCAAVTHQRRQEPHLVCQRAEAAIELSKTQGFVRWLGGGMITLGWARAEQGAVEEGMLQLRQGLEAWRGKGAELGLPHFLAMLAEVCGTAEHFDEGCRLLREAMDMTEKNEERHYEAELYRLQGELWQQQWSRGEGKQLTLEDIETCFCRALSIARKQRAKSLELRAAISLARLWQGQGRLFEARSLLQRVYDWFTEGLDIADLQAAKALLETLK